MGPEFSFEDLFIILRRRALFFLIPVMVIAPVGLIVVALLPSKYVAEGTILVESQQIPDNYVRSTVNAYAQERIQIIRQRVMTHNRVLEVANKYNVFPRSSGLSESERAQAMRQATWVRLITVDRRRGAGDGTIAFTVSFRHEDPGKAFRVANEFMTLFLSEDVRSRTAGASNTTEFFEREATKLRNQVASLEDQITQFKVENADALPEHLGMHLSLMERASQNLNTAQRSIEALEEEKQFLERQLVVGGRPEDGLGGRLAGLETELARLRAAYHEGYPEIAAVKNEIAAVKRQMAPSAEIQKLRDSLRDAEFALSQAERAEPVDPEAIAAAEEQVDNARQALSDRISRESREGQGDISTVQIEGRLAIIDNRIRMNQRDADRLEKEMGDLQMRIARTPAVERDLASLTRDQQNLFDEYQELRAKQQDAALAESLEENQQAEKFSILEAARRPTTPTSPNRSKLAIMVLFLAGAAGGGIALAAEILLGRLRGRDQVTRLLDEHPIAVIPYIHSEGDDLPIVGALTGFLRRLPFRPRPA